ncbi:DNA polymerase III subunit delta' [Oxalobacteraceae bacterium R-40]|uniref:DNA polymerase III subunit delta n=1 Tax=Keguizhuia sedimenti TaxID=3064264 RepID=A0ABU1BRL5_9BURK|nr:DNA polymerase III subunit delta' [Oxalobacteraceae bacterium R-40]
MKNLLFPWQNDAWRQLQQFGERLPHAILFYGPEGIGKAEFAEHFAQALLCERPDPEGHACGQCSSCGWFAQYGHPDYRRVRPEALDEGEAAGEEDGTDGEDAPKAAKSTKAPSKEIKIDQIRALSDFMNVSTHRQGRRVIFLYPAEALNAAAANALLKTLEEPPAGTVFLLVTNSLDRLLPTILSRCRKFPLPMPARDEALAWLQSQGLDKAEDYLAQQGGAPIAAKGFAEAGMGEMLDEMLAHLAQPSLEGALKTAERLQKSPLPEIVAWQQRWLYDLFSFKLSGRIRYYSRYGKQLAALSAKADERSLIEALKMASERRALASHPLSPRLVIEDMLLAYLKIFA